MEFRNYGHVSPMTGAIAPPHHTSWADAMDDSFDTYLQTKKSSDRQN
jgi:trimethylamine monooxygenase